MINEEIISLPNDYFFLIQTYEIKYVRKNIFIFIKCVFFI